MRAIFLKEIKDYKVADSFTYSGDDFHHLKNVIRLKINDSVLVLDGEGLKVETTCIEITKNHIKFYINNIQKDVFHPRECIISQIKRESLELAFRSAVELGVTKFHIVKTDFSQNFKFNDDRLEKIGISAMIQSNNSYQCEIIYHSGISSLVDLTGENLIIFDNSLDKKIEDSNKKQIMDSSPIIFIGPEGGFSENEIKKFKQMGALSHCFKSPILRSETALIAAITYRYL